MWPDPVTPINVLDFCLIGGALGKAQASARAEANVVLWKGSLGCLPGQINRQAEDDNHTPKGQRGRAAAKNVSTKFIIPSHSYIGFYDESPRPD